MIDVQCIRTCYDSLSCKLYEEGRPYTIDENAFALDGGNGLIKHFLPFNQMDRDRAKQAEKEYDALREREAKMVGNTRAEALRTEPSEKPRPRAKARA